MTSRIAVVVLAAGQGRRFDADSQVHDHQVKKVVAHLHGVPLVRKVVSAALASRAISVTVVTGHAQAEVANALSGLDAQIVHNPNYATGVASSLKVGLTTMPSDVDGFIVMLADMPLVRKDTIDRLIAQFEARPTQIHAVVPVHDSRRGNPVLIGRRLFAGIETLAGDEGARSLLRQPATVVDLCDVDDPGIFIDIDTPAELMALSRSG